LPPRVLALLSLRDQFVFLGKGVEDFIAGPSANPELRAAVEAYGDDLRAQTDLRRRQRDQLAKNVEQRVAEIARQYRRLESDLRARND
jgi:response regulator RpfG family c-di-GMP phosphodiesterase